MHIYCFGIRGREEALDDGLRARVRTRLESERSAAFPTRLLRLPHRVAIDRVLAELERGVGLVFEGFLDARARAELGSFSSLAKVDEGRPMRFVVLPESGLVLEWSGALPERWVHLALRRVASATVAMEAHVASIGRKQDEGALELKRRHLDAEEKAELAGLVAVAHRKAVRESALVAGVGLVVALGLRALLVRAGFTLDALLVAGVGLLPSLVHYVRHRTAYRALVEDVRDGFVFVIRTADDGQLGPSLGEVLPHSELPWTEDGQPARYRT
ncbi:MAG: hypothetical protein U0230_18110 [Polyangiales bacterium]